MIASAGASRAWLVADWRVDGAAGLMTTRRGGASAAPFDSMNLGSGVGDAPEAVGANRRLLAAALGARPVYLMQVHGSGVVRIGAADTQPDAPVHRADASVTTERGVACAVLVADCLPVLFAAPDGRGVGAAHAGWRGLALGVLEATLAALCEAAGCGPGEVSAWMGACIGPAAFEVGADVPAAFGIDPDRSARFQPGAPGKWFADLAGLAADRLQAARVGTVRGIARPGRCTVAHPSRFFSFRRDRITGRMAAVAWIGGRPAA